MNLRIARHQIMVTMGEEVEIPLSRFDNDDPSVAALQLVALPFNEQSIQVVTIAHVRTEVEQAVYDAEIEAFGLGALEDLEDEL